MDRSSLMSAVIGAVFGAGASAIPAYLLASKASRETLARDRISRDEQMKAATYRAMVKLLEMVNGVMGLRRQIGSAGLRSALG